MNKMEEYAIRVKKIKSGYGQSNILFGVDFEAIKKGITVIVGPNGGGKSTLLKSIFGLCTIHDGSVEYFGKDITSKPPHSISRMGIAYLPQINNVFANLTVRENLSMAAYAVSESMQLQRISKILESFPFLQQRTGSKAGTLSGGQRQMLAMAMALMREPKVMLFDEPTANLAPKMALEVMSFPKYSTEPSCIVHRPNMLFRSVLFPPPFGPTITVIPFLIASKSTPNSILLCPYPDFIFFTLIAYSSILFTKV